MRKLVYTLALTLAGSFLLSSCSKSGSGGSGDTGGGVGNANSIKVELSKSSILADGYDEARLTVRDKAGNDVTSSASITIDGAPATSAVFYTSTAKSYNVQAKAAGLTSPAVTITATDPGPSPYSQKAIAEDYTGTWCGYCPRVAHKLKILRNNNPNIIVSAIHNADPVQYQYEAQMRSQYGVTGFPTAIVNRDFKWNEANAVLTDQLNKRAPVGLAIQSTVSGNTVTGKVKVKFDVNTTAGLRVVIALQENGIVLPQRNYYNADATSPWFGAGDPISGFVHDHTLRSASTDIFGDAIPGAVQVKGTEWEKNFTFTNPGTWNLTNCEIVAYVVFEGGNVRKGLLNAQEARVGTVKNYD